MASVCPCLLTASVATMTDAACLLAKKQALNLVICGTMFTCNAKIFKHFISNSFGLPGFGTVLRPSCFASCDMQLSSHGAKHFGNEKHSACMIKYAQYSEKDIYIYLYYLFFFFHTYFHKLQKSDFILFHTM